MNVNTTHIHTQIPRTHMFKFQKRKTQRTVPISMLLFVVRQIIGHWRGVFIRANIYVCTLWKTHIFIRANIYVCTLNAPISIVFWFSVKLTGIDGMHLKNTSLVGYVGYQQSCVCVRTHTCACVCVCVSARVCVCVGRYMYTYICIQIYKYV